MASNRDIDRAITKYQRRINEFRDLFDLENKKYYKYCERDYYRIAKEEINNFYEEYQPRFYKRTYGLFGAPHYEMDGNGIIHTEFVAEDIKYWHRIKGLDYLMDLTLVEGWHGGAKSGPPDKKGNPFPGIPGEEAYWRKPPKAKNGSFIPGVTYAFWGRRAFRGEHQNVEEQTDIRFAEALEKRKDDKYTVLNNRLDEIIDELTKVIEKLL